jgi:hypothetical protein
MARCGGTTTLWRYVAYLHGRAFEVEPIAAETAARALELAHEALSESEYAEWELRAESLLPLQCSTPDCLGHAATDRAGRYLCDACATWFAPGLF